MKKAKRNEFDSYLEENLLPPMSGIKFNILEWRKPNATHYPILSNWPDFHPSQLSILGVESGPV